MAPCLPDVFLILVFQKLSANDRLSASQVCSNWYHRVREVNQNVQFLTIIVGRGRFNDNNWLLNYTIFGHDPCIKQQLIKEKVLEGVDEEDIEKLQCSTKQNTFTAHLNLSYRTAQLIISLFPAITELNFVNQSYDWETYEYLVHMLRTVRWKPQLLALRIIEQNEFQPSLATCQRVFKAINNLPSLRRLALQMYNQSEKGLQCITPVLPVLACLKEVRYEVGNENHLQTFLMNVIINARENVDLQIDMPAFLSVLRHLLDENPTYVTGLIFTYFHERIVRIADQNLIDSLTELDFFCHLFPHLTSISITCTSYSMCAPMFASICENLSHLCHLVLNFDFQIPYEEFDDDFGDNDEVDAEANGANADNHDEAIVENNGEAVEDADDANNHDEADEHNDEHNDEAVENADPENNDDAQIDLNLLRPSAPLASVKALDLVVTLTSHFDLQWLNLSVTMPNVQTIHFISYECLQCNIESWNFNVSGGVALPELAATIRKCFAEVLPQLSHSTGVPLENIYARVDDGQTTVTGKQLLSS